MRFLFFFLAVVFMLTLLGGHTKEALLLAIGIVAISIVEKLIKGTGRS